MHNNIWQIWKNKRLMLMLSLGFASGLPLALSGNTLQAWLTVDGVDIKAIGLFSLVGLPYTIKFLWAPIMDRFVPPFLGRRRGWMALMQALIAIIIAAFSFLNPSSMVRLTALLAILLAFASASHDIVFDAYRTDVLPTKERGLGAALSVAGYRVAMLVSGAIALIAADHFGWHITYFFMACLMAGCILFTVIAPNPDQESLHPSSLTEAIIEPFRDFFSREKALAFLVLILLYKIGDAFAGVLTTPFLIRGVGFTLTEVGTVNKAIGLLATIGGAIYGGVLMARLGLFRSLIFFGILQAISNLSFMLLAYLGHNVPAMIAAVLFENISGGMGTAAFVAFLMALCNHRYSASQYAMLSAFASAGRVFVAPPSGFLAEAAGWPLFFFITAIAAIPGLLLLLTMRKDINLLEINPAQIQKGKA